MGLSSKKRCLALREYGIRQGPLAPRELPRFHATMAPSDSRAGPTTVIHSRRQFAVPHLHGLGDPTGLPGSSMDLLTPAVPYNPGESDRCVARCFAVGGRLRPFGGDSHSHLRL